MNGLARTVVCSLFLVVCSSTAFADTVSVSGNVSFDQNYLTFAPPFQTQTNTGDFSEFSNGYVQYYLGTVPYVDGVPATELTFSITSGNGDVLRFFDQGNTPTKSYDGNGNLVVALTETGYYTVDNGAPLSGYFDLTLNGTSSTGSASNVAFQGSGGLSVPIPSPVRLLDVAATNPAAALGVAPEPTSILLLGTGLLGLATLVRARSRKTPQRNA